MAMAFSNIFLLGLSLIFINYVSIVHCQLLNSEKMNLGVYNPETKKYEQVSPKVLGGDDHDLKPHEKKILGEDDHDLIPHQKKILGGDDHDLKPHQKKILGGDDHDLKPHQKLLIGGDDHDYRHLDNKRTLGGDDHDYKPHSKKKFIGGDDHDYKPHNKKFSRGGKHHKHHMEKLIGRDNHDYIYKQHSKKYLGGGKHDFNHHSKKMLGEGDHDYKPHGKKLIGGGDHDYKIHSKKVIGGGNHDYKPHNKKVIGGGDHDYKKHNMRVLGKGPHDYMTHRSMKHFKKDSKHLKLIGVFHDFVKTFNRTYNSHKEFMKKYNIFRRNMKKVTTLQLNEKGSAKYGITKFSDMSAYEFRTMLGLRPHLKPSVSLMKQAEIPDVEAPEEFDWRSKNVVTPVKNQGMCGSCWAFSVTGNVEGQWALKHNKLFSLSEQELVDCDTTDQGCNGGMPENAYKAIEDLGGLETEDGYPYDGKDEKCKIDTKKIKVQVNGSVELPVDEELMKKWLFKNGPISIGINANALQFYMGGVSHPFKFLCSPDDLDHGMLIVGYGVHTTKYLQRVQPYWLVKNSWGEDWGEKGYYRVYRGDGTCGVNKMATSAIVP